MSHYGSKPNPEWLVSHQIPYAPVLLTFWLLHVRHKCFGSFVYHCIIDVVISDNVNHWRTTSYRGLHILYFSHICLQEERRGDMGGCSMSGVGPTTETYALSQHQASHHGSKACHNRVSWDIKIRDPIIPHVWHRIKNVPRGLVLYGTLCLT